MAELISGVPDELLAGPTPCPGYTLGDLLDHIGGLTLAFTAAAIKATGETGSQGPSGDGSRMGDDWRTRIPRDLAALAEAWRVPAAWSGTTQAGGIELPGDVAGLVALDELVIHGWDVARAGGQAYDSDARLLEVVRGFVAQFSVPGQEVERQGLFGPVVDVSGGRAAARPRDRAQRGVIPPGHPADPHLSAASVARYPSRLVVPRRGPAPTGTVAGCGPKCRSRTGWWPCSIQPSKTRGRRRPRSWST